MAARLVPADAEVVRGYEEAYTAEMVGRNCQLTPYHKVRVPSFRIDDDFIAFVAPESAYAVNKRLLDAATRSILIGIYDFTAGYLKDRLVAAMRRGVKVSLMLDLDGRTGETALFDDLVRHGCDGVPAPSCASAVAHYFPSSHEKVIVVDDIWSIVMSGNYTENSVPENERDGGDPRRFVPGNRDTGIAVRSKPLAAFLSGVLRSDIQLERHATHAEAIAGPLAQLGELEMFQAAPKAPPPRLFPSQTFHPRAPVPVTPVLSPDNYMSAVPNLLASATRSIAIEQQYIRGAQPEVQHLLGAIRDAVRHHPRLVVRVIVAMPFPGKTYAKEAQAIRDLGSNYGLQLGTHLRILNPRYFVHCHDKLIVVDDAKVLVSSQNWSDFAVAKNREAGLLIESAPIAGYYARVFDLDWTTGLRTLPAKPRGQFFGPEALGTGKVVPLPWGDYAEV